MDASLDVCDVEIGLGKYVSENFYARALALSEVCAFVNDVKISG